MKKLLSLLTLLVVAVSTFGQTFTLGDLEYTVLSSTDKTAKVSSGKNATGDVVVPETVTYNDVEYSVTEIGLNAFKDNTSVTSIDMPSVTTIGVYAFYYCSSLVSVSLPAATSIGNSAFYNCSKVNSLRIGSVEQWCKVNFNSSNYANPLNNTSQTVDLYIGNSETPATSIEVPNTVTEIANYAFSKTTITSFSAPAAISIGSYAFYGCSALTSVSLPRANSIGYSAFQNCSKISTLRIGSVEQWCKVNFNNSSANPLYNTSQIVGLFIGDSETPATSIEVPNTVTEIPDNAFRRTSIISFSAPTATSIGSSTFSYCTSLTSISLPVATSIGISAFQGCSSLASVSLPAVTSISSSAFQGCSSLTSASLPAVTSISSSAFQSCSSLVSVSLPAVISIGSSAFQSCYSLTSVSLPVATSIGSSAFYSCSSLTSVSLPAVTSIGSSAFSQCATKSLRIGSVEQWCNIEYGDTDVNSYFYSHQFPLRSDYDVNIYIGDSDVPASEITIPASVQSIPCFAFRGTSIHTIHFEGTTPPALTRTNSFPTWTMLAVPEEAYETYLAADVYNTIPLQITKDGHITQDVEVEADNGTSKLMQKIGGENEVRYVVNLKVTGTINSYDMLIIRNQMTSLRNLDLTDASIVDCDYVYSNANGVNYHSQKDVVTGDWLMGVMNVRLPATAKAIGGRAFYNNTKLVSVTIPDGVTSIESEAFYGCNRIKELSLPQSVTSFGTSAFTSCTGLREVVIPDGVVSISSYAFNNCVDLEKVTIPASVTSIGSRAFSGRNPLELHVNSLESWLNVQNESYTFDNVAKFYVGDSEEPVEAIVIPEGTTAIKDYAFPGFKCLKSVLFPADLSTIGSYAFQDCTGLTKIALPENVTAINNYTFSGCSNLEKIEFDDNLKSIGQYAFGSCSKLSKVELPAYLESIASYAFQSCSNLSEILIPASIKEIKDHAFKGCSNMNRVIATTVEPVRINQNTFSTYQTATLFIPKTSYDKYYWNAQYNQFLGKKEYDKEFAKSFEYKYFYLNGVNGDEKQDLTIDDETGTIHGAGDKNPDADFNEGAGVIVSGEQIQNLGDIHIHHNGNNGASVIAKNQGKVHIDNLYVDIKTQKNRWYFFCFPFDIKPSEANFDGSHVWYLYDGAARALNGNGGWKKVASDGVMQSGYGYIFQGAINGTLTIHVKDITIDTNDNSTNMITYQSDNKNDASWNLIGNSNFAYYDINNLGYEAPITVYNNETGNYEAVRAGEDDCELYPFQAFFVQKPEGTESLDFDNSMKETKNMSDASQAKKAAARAKAPKKVDALRKVINLELASADLVADSVAVPTDRTRIVVNPTKSTAYETDCDAAKFLADNMPQIYSLGLDGCIYAINERPVANGIVSIAVKTVKSGMYTITAPRLDREAKLRDLETGAEVDLSKGGYTFAAEVQTYTDRFQLILADEATAITAAEDEMAGISVEAGAIRVSKANADVKIYSVGGSLVASQKGEGSIHMPAGIYVVVVNGKSTKVTVKE